MLVEQHALVCGVCKHPLTPETTEIHYHAGALVKDSRMLKVEDVSPPSLDVPPEVVPGYTA